MSGSCSCKDCKRVREHVASLLPIKVLESAANQPLRIAGIAMAAGISRNFNVYTPQELAAFAEKLVGAPVYMEHVEASNATGKVTKCTYDAASRCLLYEAEIYDAAIAEKIRKGLIQHVSVGADYSAIDVVDAKIPRGLYNPELSLVAVPGVPETNIQVLEHFLHEQLEPQMPGEYMLGFTQDPTLFLAEHSRVVWLDQANGILALMAKTKADPAVERCQSILFSKEKWQPNTVADWLKMHPDYASSAGTGVYVNGSESLEEKDIDKIAEKVALKVGEKESVLVEKLKSEITEAKSKQGAAEIARDKALGDLSEANKAVEDLKKIVPGVDLLKNPPKLMPVSECLERLGRCDLPKMQERLSLGNQVQAQKVRKEIFEVKQKYGVA
jgi:hypothetical protein